MPNPVDFRTQRCLSLKPDMGEHSREGSVAGDAPFDGEDDTEDPGREGIGNVGGEGSETHPSDLAGALGGDCDVEEED